MALSAPPSVTDEDDEDAVPMSFRVGIVIYDAKDGYVARANNLHSFLSLSRSVREVPLLHASVHLTFQIRSPSPLALTLCPQIQRIAL